MRNKLKIFFFYWLFILQFIVHFFLNISLFSKSWTVKLFFSPLFLFFLHLIYYLSISYLLYQVKYILEGVARPQHTILYTPKNPWIELNTSDDIYLSLSGHYLGLNKNKLRMLLSMMICWLLSSFTWLIYFTITANSFVSITKRVKYLMWPNSIYLQGKSIEQYQVLSIISITFLSLI